PAGRVTERVVAAEQAAGFAIGDRCIDGRRRHRVAHRAVHRRKVDLTLNLEKPDRFAGRALAPGHRSGPRRATRAPRLAADQGEDNTHRAEIMDEGHADAWSRDAESFKKNRNVLPDPADVFGAIFAEGALAGRR